MARAQKDKTDVAEQLFRVFRERGYDGATLADLSRATGLGRASLYHHFPGGKEDMAAAVLDHVAGRFRDEILAPLSGDAPVETRLKTMAEALADFYEEGRQLCAFGQLALSAPPGPIRKRISGGFRAWVGAIARVLTETGMDEETAQTRAENAVIGVQGALILAHATEDPEPFRRIVRRMPADLLA